MLDSELPTGQSGSRPARKGELDVRVSRTNHLIQKNFAGPLPSPDTLRQYEDICPGYAERILKRLEAETQHRHSIEHKIVDSRIAHDRDQFKEARLGQILAFLITVVALAGGVYTALCGHEVAGSIIGVGGIGGVVTTFIVGRARQAAALSKQQTESGQPQLPKLDNVKKS